MLIEGAIFDKGVMGAMGQANQAITSMNKENNADKYADIMEDMAD